MLEDMVTTVTKHLKRGARIRIGGLGILQVRKRPARMGHNPATGEAIKIKASKKVAFRAAKDLKRSGLAGSGAAIFPHGGVRKQGWARQSTGPLHYAAARSSLGGASPPRQALRPGAVWRCRPAASCYRSALAVSPTAASMRDEALAEAKHVRHRSIATQLLAGARGPSLRRSCLGCGDTAGGAG